MKIYMVRHGQSQFNDGQTTAFNSEVTVKGVEQANKVAAFLKDEIKNKCVGYVSPYIRCLQTALPIESNAGINFKVMPEIGESPEDIHKTGATVYSLATLIPSFDWFNMTSSYSYTRETQEKYDERINNFLDLIKKEDKDCLVVSHQTPITHMIRKLCFDNCPQPITIVNCSVSLIENFKPVYLGKVI